MREIKEEFKRSYLSEDDFYYDNPQTIVNEMDSNINDRSEEHTSELQSHSFISYAVFCLKKKKKQH